LDAEYFPGVYLLSVAYSAASAIVLSVTRLALPLAVLIPSV